MSNNICSVIKRLLEEGMHPYNITLFFPEFSISEISRIAIESGLPPCKKGRPREHFGNLSGKEKESVAKMFLVGFDIITIARVLGVDINGVCYFLIVDDTPFGVGCCVECRLPFVYVGYVGKDETRHCPDCICKLNRKKKAAPLAGAWSETLEDARSLSL